MAEAPFGNRLGCQESFTSFRLPSPLAPPEVKPSKVRGPRCDALGPFLFHSLPAKVARNFIVVSQVARWEAGPTYRGSQRSRPALQRANIGATAEVRKVSTRRSAHHLGHGSRTGASTVVEGKHPPRELLRTLRAAFDPSLHQLAGCFLVSRSRLAALARVPTPSNEVVFSDMLLQ